MKTKGRVAKTNRTRKKEVQRRRSVEKGKAIPFYSKEVAKELLAPRKEKK